MRCLDSRRLTGPNLLWGRPGAVIDVDFEDDDPEEAVDAWRHQARRMLEAVGWDREEICVRRFRGGASLAISAPVDALYAATDINDWAFEAARDVLGDRGTPDIERDAPGLIASIREEGKPGVIALWEAARARRKPVLIDTEEVSVGLGRYSRTWPLDAVPDLDDVPWGELSAVPVGMITGTNGKTTSVRLAASIARAAGYTVGLSSTDWIAVGDDVLDAGDYSGPGGARAVLRDRRVDLAILETARGGLLRRGLAMEHADAVLITNVAADHLGEFGVQDVDELADVKWTVTRALGEHSALVLNADDARLVERAKDAPFDIIWFAPDPDNAVLTEHASHGGTTCSVSDGGIAVTRNRARHSLVAIDQVPVTFQGAARHNVYNALGVVGLALGLGISLEDIRAGLCALDPNDNPGRCNIYEINGATFIVDFAHNPHGMAAFVHTAGALPSRRRSLLIGQAGDRSDLDIRELAATACRSHWDRVVIKEMDDYARGRDRGETADILFSEFTAQGIPPDHIHREARELDAVRKLVEDARPGDLVALLIHERRKDVLQYLSRIQTAG
jgi:cyanophycin synthetase